MSASSPLWPSSWGADERPARHQPAPLFKKLCLIGLGLIGSSIARAARAKNAVREIAAYDASLAGSRARARTWDRGRRQRRLTERAGKAPISSSSAFPSAPLARRRGPARPIWSAAPFSPMSARSRARSRRRSRPIVPAGRAFRAGASARRHRIFRPGLRLFDAVREPLVPADADARYRRRHGRGTRRILEAARRQGRGDDAGASRSRAGGDEPSAASDRLQHRGNGGASRNRHAVRGDQILGLGLSRLHPHRRLRPDHVARRVPA